MKHIFRFQTSGSDFGEEFYTHNLNLSSQITNSFNQGQNIEQQNVLIKTILNIYVVFYSFLFLFDPFIGVI